MRVSVERFHQRLREILDGVPPARSSVSPGLEHVARTLAGMVSAPGASTADAGRLGPGFQVLREDIEDLFHEPNGPMLELELFHTAHADALVASQQAFALPGLEDALCGADAIAFALDAPSGLELEGLLAIAEHLEAVLPPDPTVLFAVNLVDDEDALSSVSLISLAFEGKPDD